jgi:hypothetical protein
MNGTWAEALLLSFRGLPWSEVRSLLELTLYFLAIAAILGCLVRLGTIRSIIQDFREARGPLWDLRTTVTDLKELEPVLRLLTEQVALVDEKVEAARKQVAELQVDSISNRTDASEDASNEFRLNHETRTAQQVTEDDNWLALRDFWRRNTQRLEYVIDQISDGRTKVAYDRLPRTNYDRIINRLQGQKFISAAAANASRSLNELFYKFRPRNRAVPDEVIGSLKVLDQSLDRELVPISKVLDSEDDTSPPIRPPPQQVEAATPQSGATPGNQPNQRPSEADFPG